MIYYLLKRLLASFTLSLLIIMVVNIRLLDRIITGVAAEASQVKTLDRNLEPVVIKGNKVSFLIGSPISYLCVYTYNGITWGGQIPVQIDEIIDGTYTATEDGLLDSDDEIVFMAKDLGNRAPNPASLTTTFPISATWYEIEVIDPLSPTQKGWAYLVLSNHIEAADNSDYVNYITATQHVVTNQYGVGFTTTYAGLDYLNLNGGNNILDRTKLRVVVTTSILTASLTENDLNNDVEIVLVKDGPIRVILEQKVSATPGGLIPIQANLNLTHLVYVSLLQSTTNVSFTLPNFINIAGVRTSVDFNRTVAGAKFYNARTTPDSVTIDGNPDAVGTTPLSNWSQVSTTTGRLVQVTNPDGATPQEDTQKNYYCDDNSSGLETSECDNTPQTGDGVSYGDSGLLIEGDINKMFTLDGVLFVLAPAHGGTDNVGETYVNYFFNPLLVTVGFQGTNSTSSIFLPTIFNNR